MKVLVATGDLTFSVSLSHAYKALGHDVSAGIPELYLGLRDFDLIHFHWPEELTGWTMPPPPSAVRRVLAQIDTLKRNPATKMICTVHNLLPHADRDGESEALYKAFYARMDLIGHFSESSRDAVGARFPEIASSRHVVHGMQDFANLRVHATGRADARQRLGIADEARVVAIVGQLRALPELRLTSRALSNLRLPAMHLIRAFRPPAVSGIVDRARRKYVMRSFAHLPATVLDGYIDDAQLVAVCEAADIIVIPRMENHLNSGVLPLAMTFGTAVVAPDCGVFHEMLAGSMNELYTPGDASAMTKAIERLAAKNAVEVRACNLALAVDWGWSHGVRRLLKALPN